MFRIVFDPKLGSFVIEVGSFSGLIWRRVMGLGNGLQALEEVLEFPSYDDALNHVKKIGLDKLYEDKSANKYRQYMAEGGVK